ncbi:MAG: hypothetical protein KKG76_12255 [Euryarchaeota archaeon]|nr:hypothetical protein [Euryarchaeota archaeon]MBU4139181.1 hypothetical protein [Euryarchaeota archaeon]
MSRIVILGLGSGGFAASLAIRNGMDIYSLFRTEMAYCPMLAENYDVLNKACDFAVRRMGRK